MLSNELEGKLEALRQRLVQLGSVAVAFSAGIDSALLLAVAHDTLGERVVALTASSPAQPRRETDEAIEFCTVRGIRQIVFRVNELDIDGFRCNPENRCYLCKRSLFEEMGRLARTEGVAQVVEGSNVDDLGGYRPGMQALAELGIESPLLSCGFTKRDVRDAAREMGLASWRKPSFACLYTRFPYGEELTLEKLQRVGAAEQLLVDLGFEAFRVRAEGRDSDAARIELDPADIPSIVEPSMREQVASAFNELGFVHVSVDLQGYRTGSMDESMRSGAR